VLIARNKDKLNKVADEMKKINPSIQTKVVTADFGNSTNLALFDEIYAQIKDLDISILVNNVGTDILSKFHEHTDENLKTILTLNVFPIVFLCKKLITKMRTRKQRSGIINVSSVASIVPMPFFGTYGATKAFDDFFSRSL